MDFPFPNFAFGIALGHVLSSYVFIPAGKAPSQLSVGWWSRRTIDSFDIKYPPEIQSLSRNSEPPHHPLCLKSGYTMVHPKPPKTTTKSF